MAVRIRLKKMGRTHRPFFRVCAMDSRTARDGRVIEQLGTYNPMIADVDARAVLNGERINYWLGVGAKPTQKVGTLIKKYGAEGTHLEAQAEALSKLSTNRATSIEAARKAAAAVEMPKAEPEPTEEEKAKAAEGEAAAEAPADGEAAPADEAKADAKAEAPAEEAKADAPAEEAKEEKAEAPAEEAKAEEPKAEEAKAEAPAEEAKAEEAPAEEKAE